MIKCVKLCRHIQHTESVLFLDYKISLLILQIAVLVLKLHICTSMAMNNVIIYKELNNLWNNAFDNFENIVSYNIGRLLFKSQVHYYILIIGEIEAVFIESDSIYSLKLWFMNTYTILVYEYMYMRLNYIY